LSSGGSHFGQDEDDAVLFLSDRRVQPAATPRTFCILTRTRDCAPISPSQRYSGFVATASIFHRSWESSRPRRGRFLAAISGYLFDLADTDDQVIIDKVATKLPKWKGRLLNKPGRLTLVNSVLTSVVLYHMMVFSLSKWAIRRIDNIRQGFLWQGSENAQGGNCMVNWQRAQRSKKLGGLGILDLAKFNLPLQLSWH
jgi:hypothetical protein